MTTRGDRVDLPAISPPEALDARVRRLAHAELRAATGPRWQVLAVRAWNQVCLPAAVVVTVVGYLSWAVHTASALAH